MKFIDHPDLALELLMIKLCKLNNVTEISDLINQLNSDNPSISNKQIVANKSINEQKKNNKNESILGDTVEIQEDAISRIDLENDTKNNSISDKSINGKNNNFDEKSKANNESIDKDIVNKKLTDIINFIDERNSKTAGFMGDIEVMEVDEHNITIKVNNISKFLYDTLLKDIPLIKDAFNRTLSTAHHIVIVKGKELDAKNKKEKNMKVEEEHPLLMDALEKFDGKIIK